MTHFIWVKFVKNYLKKKIYIILIMKQYTYHAVINNIKIESCNIEVLVQDINSTIGFPIVSRDSLFNYFNRPERMKS
jgi:hypothetical protein